MLKKSVSVRRLTLRFRWALHHLLNDASTIELLRRPLEDIH